MSAIESHGDGTASIGAAARRLFSDWGDVNVAAVHRGAGTTTVGVWRVVSAQSSSTAAQAIAKEVRCVAGDACRSASCEAHVELGIASNPGALQQVLGRAECLAVERPDPQTFRMWFEDLGQDCAEQWSPNVLFAVARSAGAFSAQNPEGSFPVGGHDFLLRYAWAANDALPLVEGLDPEWRELLFPDDHEARARADLSRAARNAPSRGACFAAHHDLNARNLFVDVEGHWRAIDWATFGWAPLGEDLAWLVYGSAFLTGACLRDLDEFEQAGSEGYAAGCADAGVAISAAELLQRARDTARVRLAAYSFLRAPLLANAMTRDFAEQVAGCAIETFVTCVAQLRNHLHHKTK